MLICGRCSRNALRYAFPLSMLTTSISSFCSGVRLRKNPSRLAVPLPSLSQRISPVPPSITHVTNFLSRPRYFSSIIKARLPSMQIGRTSSTRVRMSLSARRILLCDRRKSLESSRAEVSCINLAMYPIRRRVMQRLGGILCGLTTAYLLQWGQNKNRVSLSAAQYRTAYRGYLLQ